MPAKDREFKPIALIGVGACYVGCGAALSAAFSESWAGAVVIGLVAVGLVFMILGLGKRRELQSGKTRGDDEDRQPA